jgi:membrane protein
MLSWLKKSALLFYRAGDNLVENDGMEMAGYLTFLALLALFPFLVILVATAGSFGQGELGDKFIELMVEYVPRDMASALTPRIQEIVSGPPPGLLTVSILGALWTASSAVEGLRTVLNRAYAVNEPPHYALRRLVSILQVFLFTALIMSVMSVLVFAPVALAAFTGWTGIAIPLAITQFFLDDFMFIAGGLMLAGIASLYYWLPNIKQELLAVVPGALLVVVLWVAGAGLVTYYLDNISQVNIIYGSLSSLIATLIFFYVMNIIFIYGAEFNHQLMVMLGKRIVEKERTAPARKHTKKR